ncbi:hypothetical protein DL89DRAFT_267727 [Linderina pennispora]|uniref:Large ribosomal subunit protein bL21m n=1 Tax=Linderina pennispora TaxID=61395 RepID=A0A1Y1W7W2_9FUNG|nr:uncharacterized protein DL89DRAFT_267727 [Linderina pennispora]ORX69532.1 hypothetical protein DL89DRAFT_267727 [Linderina pennispora]
MSLGLIGRRALGGLSQSARQYATAAAATAPAVKWSSESTDLINRLRDQQKYYATVLIKGRPFTVTQNDVIIMDRIKELELGDALALNQVTEIGSRDYTIKGQPLVDPSLFKIQATVIEHPDGKLFKVVKKKQRTAHQRTTHHRNHHTMLRISMLDVNKI